MPRRALAIETTDMMVGLQEITCQILESGFENLAEALGDVAGRLESSIDNLSGSLSGSIEYLESSNKWNNNGLVGEIKSVRDDLISRRRRR
jgi:hypothetical protein